MGRQLKKPKGRRSPQEGGGGGKGHIVSTKGLKEKQMGEEKGRMKTTTTRGKRKERESGGQ